MSVKGYDNNVWLVMVMVIDIFVVWIYVTRLI